MSKTSSPLDPRVLNSAKQAPVWSHAPGAVSSGATGRARSTPRRRGAAEDESEGEEERPVWPTASAAVRKIVLGQPPMGDAKGELLALPVGEPLPDLAASFPNLTHLYLWQVAGLRELPPLPAGLVGLDVRGCPGLERVGNLPAGLETLVLEDCARLAAVPAVVGKWERLRELSVKGCGALAEAWVWAVVAAARALRFFGGSECGQLAVAPVWPPKWSGSN